MIEIIALNSLKDYSKSLRVIEKLTGPFPKGNYHIYSETIQLNDDDIDANIADSDEWVK